ncbi:sigma 54-interacting transcriptional regulator [Aquabacterium sp. J223]|uniref:sigma 54-interacting transcriptional regulator n=1 Tax=Aquabacterium sp. J223 TaxID=2898431 RepID=UPI0021AD8056|nr:sigma 54-interacting transcriptional regulator [Aquabacterium sp. J223]UUX94341.1 sigma 54-interacting transcriptional regulator [Aquabacterium sp. J223]
MDTGSRTHATAWAHRQVLVVDDEQGMRNFLDKTIALRGAEVASAESAEAAEPLLRSRRFDVLVLDISLPGKSGLQLLRELREQGFPGEVILITAFADLETAIEALRAGASDFILKPFRIPQIVNALTQSFERSRLTRENWVLKRQVGAPALDALVGGSALMRQLREALQRAAAVNSTVLLTGESGTGKELAALTLHRASGRARGPFVPVNCATVSPELIESELFGHARGAFTGATKARDGLFYYAQGGTLFLDQVSELPPAAQAALLRVLEDRRIRPVGSEQEIAVDVRIVAATHRPLAAEVAAGRFRDDLYYRLQVLEVALPPLRQHKEDIPALLAHFIALLAPALGVPPIDVSDAELDYLRQYRWPGNVRELRNLVERSLILGSLNVSALYPGAATPEPDDAAPVDLAGLEKRHILQVLDSVRGDKTRARAAARHLAAHAGAALRRMAGVTRWWRPWPARASVSVRHKLLALVLLPLLVVLPLLGVLLLLWGNAAVDRLLIDKVRSDLAVAQGYFDRVLSEVGSGTQAVAGSHRLVASLAEPSAVQRLLREGRQRYGLDFLNLLTPEARLWVGDDGLALSPADEPMPQLAADATGTQASVALLSVGQLRRIAPQLAPRAIQVLTTPNAAPGGPQVEDRALVLIARAPVQAADGRLLGHLQGGVLLNRNLGLVDHLNEIVYPPGSLPFGSQGTATLFLDDVRIATNVRLFGSDDRAIGTRVSAAVREAVLDRGQTWLGRAFVVDDWYVSGYLPLADREQRRVGMLYVGYLERPFTAVKLAMLAAIGVIFFTVMIAAAWFSLRWARDIFRPLERMAQTMAQVEGGAADARVGRVETDDEIGRLARHFDHLLDTLDEQRRALERSRDELDRKVIERTAELQTAQQQLVRSEKLAAIGQLTASIAHEVNNPIAVIQGNLDLARELLGPAGEPVRAELALADAQIERMRLIVTRLLQFARPTDYAGYVDAVDVEQALDDSLVLVGHLLGRSRIALARRRGATRPAGVNRQELQQVLVNLLVNAVQAMPEGGRLLLASRDAADGRLALDIADSGPGLAPEVARSLFQPFVTTKKDGTGLGLWISRSLLERYGGDITAAPGDAGGAVFTVWLPAAA